MPHSPLEKMEIIFSNLALLAWIMDRKVSYRVYIHICLLFLHNNRHVLKTVDSGGGLASPRYFSEFLDFKP